MPIFMDRHDVSETVTAEMVAHLHKEDLKVQDEFACRALTYWFDDKRKTAFCLIEAPDQETLQQMHNKAHGQIPNHIIEVDPSLVESFLGRIEDPEQGKDGTLAIIDEPAFRTILVISSDQLLVRQATTEALPHAPTADLIKTHKGKLVKQRENYALASFDAVANAVQAAFAVQKLNRETATLTIALSAGVPVTGQNPLFEETVKLAERMSKALEGKLVISADVHELYTSESGNRLNKATGAVFLTRADELFLNCFMDCIESTWRNPNLTVEDFNKPLGLSKSQFYRKLVALTTKSPNTFIRDYRLSEALNLLCNNTGNVSEIAFDTGFSSPSYFSKCFLKRYGHLPSDLLRR